MSYAMTYRSFGAVATPMPGAATSSANCASGAQFNATDQDCYCPPGFESTDTFRVACKPTPVTEPCAAGGKIRNPVNKQCGCPPGQIVNPDPRFSDCMPGYWFPDCLDAQGNRIPNCVYGLPMTRALPIAAAGLGVGIALTLLFNALR